MMDGGAGEQRRSLQGGETCVSDSATQCRRPAPAGGWRSVRHSTAAAAAWGGGAPAGWVEGRPRLLRRSDRCQWQPEVVAEHSVLVQAGRWDTSIGRQAMHGHIVDRQIQWYSTHHT